MKKIVLCVFQKEDAQNAIIRNNLDMERTLGGLLCHVYEFSNDAYCEYYAVDSWLPSVLQYCWLGDRKAAAPIDNI